MWTADGLDPHDSPNIYGDSTNFVEVRVSTDGKVFHVWDKPSISELIFEYPYYAEVGVKYNNFNVLFAEDTNLDGNYTHDQSLDLVFHTKALIIWDSNCNWNINGNSGSGTGTITIPDWAQQPTSTSFP